MGACTMAPNFCIVTEWCEGSTLYNLLHIKDVTMSMDELLETAKETARGMGYACYVFSAKYYNHSIFGEMGGGVCFFVCAPSSLVCG